MSDKLNISPEEEEQINKLMFKAIGITTLLIIVGVFVALILNEIR